MENKIVHSAPASGQAVRGDTTVAHTSGPWTCSGDIIIGDVEHWKQYWLIGHPKTGRAFMAISQPYDASGHTTDESLANARLIAAAPDGLAFAESFVQWVEQLRRVRGSKELLPGMEAREREARAFINKATGKD